MELPDSARNHCMICGEPVDHVGLYEVTGFEEPRSQGGANKIIDRRRTGRVVGTCHAEAVKGRRVDQMSLI